MRRRDLLRGLVCAAAASALLACGGGPGTKLRAKGPPKGEGPITFAVHNGTEVPINNLYITDTEKVRASNWERMAPGSPEEEALWGADLLKSGIAVGDSVPLDVKPGRYDVRVVDRDGREQHVGGVQLKAGGDYVLELGEGGWRTRR